MRVKILEPFIRFLIVVVCEEYKHLRILLLLLFINNVTWNVKKRIFEIFHLYFLYISTITEEHLPSRFDNKYGFLD